MKCFARRHIAPMACVLFGLIGCPLVHAQTGSIALVQQARLDAGVRTSSSLAFAASNTAGNFIAVALRAGRSHQVFTVSDSLGNLYRKAAQIDVTLDMPFGDTLAVFYAENTKAGANVVTVSQSTGATLHFAILEYSGVALANALDGTAAAQGIGRAPASGSTTTTASGNLVFGAITTAVARRFTAGTAFTIQTRVPATRGTTLIVEDRIQPAAGAASATARLNAVSAWGAVVAAFRPATAPPGTGPLTVSANPNYFKDASGRPLILNGSHTWNSLQDWGLNGSPQPFDFDAYVDFLRAHGHNFTLLWYIELPRFCNLPTTASSPPQFTVSPHPWQRTGPGNATDGAPKFDLTKFDPAYFDRLRSRVEALNDAGIYVGVYTFTGEFVYAFRCANDGYPFTGANNINGIDDGGGDGSFTMTSPNAITAIQDAYVERVIDTLNDLPNVLWIVSEEASPGSLWWNDHQISHIRSYESGKPFQHPIGYGIPSSTSDTVLFNSDADWIAGGSRIAPTTSCGSGTPSCKVNVNDSDHTYFGMWNESAQANRNYAWQNFTKGNQAVFMDPYVVYYPREGRNPCSSPTNGICPGPDPRWENFRNSLGDILRYSRKLNLANATPRGSLSSTSHCLAQTPSVGAEYLVYAPNGGSFTVNLSAMSSSRTLNVEWFNPSTGATTFADPVPAGSTSQSFTPPFAGDAVLYLVDAAGHAVTDP